MRRKNSTNFGRRIISEMKQRKTEPPKSLSDLKWLPAALSAAGAIAFSQYFNMLTANIFILVFGFLMYPMFKKRYSAGNGFSKASLICGALFAAFTVCTAFLSRQDRFTRRSSDASMLAVLIMFTFFYEALIYILYQRLDRVQLVQDRAEPPMKNKLAVFFGSAAIMLICWLPAFLYLYPAVITYDSIWQLRQAMGQTELTNHHPILHTMIIKVLFTAGRTLFGSDTAGAAFYSVVQQLFLASCFAYLIETLYKFCVKKAVLICVLLSYVIPLYHGMYSVSMWKDVPFGGIVAVLTALIWRLLRREGKFRLRICEGIMLFVFSFGMCLMRSNGLYAFFLVVIAGAVVFFKRNKACIGIMAAALAAAFVVKGPVYDAMGVKPVDTIESLSVPAQQIAAVIASHKPLTDEQTELLSQIIDLDRIPDEYVVSLSDPIKDLVREKDNQQFLVDHKGEFAKLYMELGVTYPFIYFSSYLDQTYGYWYPDVQYWVTAEIAMSEGFAIKGESKLGPLTDFYYYFHNAYIETPFLGLMWCIGAAVWVYIFMFGAAMRNQKKSYALVFIPLLGVYLTLLIATPVHAEFRYIYSLFTTMPVFCTLPFIKEPEKQADPAPAEENAAPDAGVQTQADAEPAEKAETA